MPKIATYGEQQVQSAVVQGPQARELPTSVFDPMGGALKDVAVAAQQIKTRIGTTQAEEALVKFERDKNALLFDPKTGYLNTQGKTAFEGATPTTDALQKLMTSHADTLDDPEARKAFEKVAQAHITSAQQHVMQHASKGLNDWETSTVKAQVENTLENAALYRGDDKSLTIQRELGKQSVMEAAQRQGLNPGDAAYTEMIQNYESSFAHATIAASINDNAKKGKAAFEKYGASLEEPDRIKLKDALEKQQKTEHTQYLSTVGVTAGRSIADKYYGQGLDAARSAVDAKYKDPEVNRAVTNELMTEFHRRDYMKQRSEVDAADKAETYLLSATPDQPRTVNGFKAERPDLWAAMSPKHQRALEAGVATVTDQKTLNDIRSKSMDQLATLNVSEYSDKLNVNDRKVVMKMVDDARTGKHDVQLQGDAQFVNAKLKQYGLSGEQLQSAIEAVNTELNSTIAEKGNITAAQRRKVITDSLSTFTIENAGFFGGDKTYNAKDIPIPELSAMNRVKSTLVKSYPNVAPAEISKNIAKAREKLIDDGKPVTGQAIIDTIRGDAPSTSRANMIPK